MRKIPTALAFVAGIGVSVGIVVQGQVSEFSDGNTQLTELSVDIASKQAEYFAKNGKYWQGLETFIPDGTIKAPIKNRKPSDVDKN